MQIVPPWSDAGPKNVLFAVCMMGDRMSCVKNDARGHRVSVEPDGNIYHEKQSRELCALHALNNLFQERVFTKRDFDNICYQLSPDAYVNPHKSMLGLGNYDVNVVMAALQTRNCDTVWFDKRKDIDGLVLENIQGFILNVPMDYKWGILRLPLRRKHWIVIRKLGQNYYNLDSKLETPEVIGKDVDLHNYLRDETECKEKELLLVVTQEVSSAATWWRPVAKTKSDKNKSDSSIKTDNNKRKSAPLADSEDKNRDVDFNVDTRIIPETGEKPKYLKKYYKDYVPIEIHRTVSKSEKHSHEDPSSKSGKRRSQPEMAAVEVEDRCKTPDQRSKRLSDSVLNTRVQSNGDISTGHKGGNITVTVVEQTKSPDNTANQK